MIRAVSGPVTKSIPLEISRALSPAELKAEDQDSDGSHETKKAKPTILSFPIP